MAEEISGEPAVLVESEQRGIGRQRKQPSREFLRDAYGAVQRVALGIDQAGAREIALRLLPQRYQQWLAHLEQPARERHFTGTMGADRRRGLQYVPGRGTEDAG